MSIYEDLKPGDFAKSTQKRLPICFCLDTSGSMMAPTQSGKTRMEELNAAFATFFEAMRANSDVAAAADIAMVTFGGQAAILQNFAPISSMNLPKIEVKPRSLTPMGEAIQVALKLLEVRKQGYKDKGIDYYQPWLVVFTDGEPEGENAIENMNAAIQMTTQLESERKLVVFNIGISKDANLDVLKRLSLRRKEPIFVGETNLNDVFDFLNKSSASIVGGGAGADGDETDVIYGKDDLMTNGKEVKIDEWCI